MNIGFGNIINADKIVAMITPDSAPAKRMIQKAKEESRLIDATQGRRTRAVIFTENCIISPAAGYIIRQNQTKDRV